MEQLARLPASATVDDVVEAIDRNGGVIVERAIPPATLEAWWSEVGPHLERASFGDAGFTGSRTRRCNSLIAKSIRTLDFLLEPHFLGAAERILVQPFVLDRGPSQRVIHPTIQINSTQAIQIWPGQADQVLHRDDALHQTLHPGRETLVLSLFAMSRFTAANGATRVIPGSHRWDDERAPRADEAVQAEMEAGSVLLYLGSTYHGGGANRTESEPRTALSLSYTPGYMRQEENQYFAVPIELARRLPRRVQELLGYAVCPPGCGWLDLGSPLALLDGESEGAGLDSPTQP